MISGGIALLLCLLLVLGVQVGFSLLIAGTTGLYIMGGWRLVQGILSTAPLSTTTSYELIVIPMFLLMAELVILSGIADGLFNSCAVWVGRVPGGLGVATAIAGAAFGSMSGS